MKLMKASKGLLALASLFTLFVSLSPARSSSGDGKVKCTNRARFTVLTPIIVRMESSASGNFEDRPSQSFLYRNRVKKTPNFTVNNSTDWCNITTDMLTLSFYKPKVSLSTDSYPYFESHRLQAKGYFSDGKSWKWDVTQKEGKGNLRGTLYPTPSADLAGCCKNPNASAGVFDPKYPLDRGFLSKDGWVIVDDSLASLMDWSLSSHSPEDAWISTSSRVPNAVDLYLFGCGDRYRQCLEDFTLIAGRIAFPSLNALGVWWSRHWGDMSGNPAMVKAIGVMSETAVTKHVLDGYKDHNLPLHVLVLDMEWHEMMSPPACKKFVGNKAWGGYSWNRTLFPDPQAFVDKLHQSRGALGIHLALNYHPDSGIDVCQRYHDAFAQALGLYPPTTGKIPDIDGPNSLNKTWTDAYFEHLINHTLADIAWTDTPKATTWTNWLYVRYARLMKKRRGINFSRYGGLGNHRTPIGFSGDTLRKFDTLKFEVYMTPLASNVAFGWWSHDIGGFSGGVIDTDWHTESAELYLRWLQFGSLSPIMRTHCRYCVQFVWSWGKYDTANITWYQLMKQPLLLRNALVPYIYTHAYDRTFLKGESLLQPMYWDEEAAQNPEAYSTFSQRQYFFGRSLLASPITDPLGGNSSVNKSIWLPTHDEWYDFFSMELVGMGPLVVQKEYDLTGIPLFARGGAILPLRDMESAYDTIASPVYWCIVPRSSAPFGNRYNLYEDDGVSLAYRENQALRTVFSYNYSFIGKTGNVSFVATLSASGQYQMDAFREHRVLLGGIRLPPLVVKCDYVVVRARGVPKDGQPSVWMDPQGRGVMISCGKNMAISDNHTFSAVLRRW